MHDNNEIDNIRKNANIVDIISSYINLTQKGKNYFCVCPFHEDHSPSMSISEEKQIYKCFSCGAAGNVFTFVKDYENVSFLEAVKIVAEKCGLTFKGTIKKTPSSNFQQEYDVMNLALKFYQNNLNTKEGTIAKEYLKKRSLDENIIKDFDLGLALNKNYSLNKLLLSKNYDINLLLNLGLINRNGEMINDVFNNRIIFPIHDLEGRPIGFTGRIYEDNDQAKYINSKESNIFKKGQILFNYHRAKNEIKRKKEVIIVEGNMDAIRMYSNGIKNVIALMGTSLTKDQVTIIKNMRAKIILMFDNDDAGELATLNNGNILLDNNLEPLIVRLSEVKDPDEYILKKGVNALISNLKNPLSFLDFKLNYYKKNKDLTKTTDLVAYIKEITASLSNMDELTQELTLKKISDTYNIPLDLLEKELKKQVVQPKREIKEEPQKKSLTKYEVASENILYYMLNDSIYINRFKKELGYFAVKKYRNIANEIIYYYDVNKTIDMASFITYAETLNSYEDIMSVIRNVNIADLKMDNFEDFLIVAQKEEKKSQIKELKEQISNELDVAKKCELANKLIELKKGCVGNE